MLRKKWCQREILQFSRLSHIWYFWNLWSDLYKCQILVSQCLNKVYICFSPALLNLVTTVAFCTPLLSCRSVNLLCRRSYDQDKNLGRLYEKDDETLALNLLRELQISDFQQVSCRYGALLPTPLISILTAGLWHWPDTTVIWKSVFIFLKEKKSNLQ